MRVSFIVLSILGVIVSTSATALESRDGQGRGGGSGGGRLYPQCYSSCMSRDRETYGCSSSKNSLCLCSNTGWSDSMHSCFKSNCRGEDHSRSKDLIYSYCKKAGYSLSGW
ncbi:hypothetical protein BDZ97DRAFT_1831900, partial [Flammula alnicola]